MADTKLKPNNDVRLIDANGLIDRINENLVGTQVGSYAEGIYLDVIDSINRSPTIEAEPVRHGHWIDCEIYPGEVVDCSNCGMDFYIVDFGCDKQEFLNDFRFCPFCGAKMDGGDKHDN